MRMSSGSLPPCSKATQKPSASTDGRRIAHQSRPARPRHLLKVGHHGSRTSTTPELLALVTPSGRRHLRRPRTPSAIPHQKSSSASRRPRPRLPHRPLRPHYLPALPRRPDRRIQPAAKLNWPNSWSRVPHREAHYGYRSLRQAVEYLDALRPLVRLSDSFNDTLCYAVYPAERLPF